MEQKENRGVLRGTVAGEAVLSHQVHGIDFYRFPLAVPRLSGREDLLNILFHGGCRDAQGAKCYYFSHRTAGASDHGRRGKDPA